MAGRAPAAPVATPPACLRPNNGRRGPPDPDEDPIISFYLKYPHSRVDYAIDWTGYLDGQIVASSQWTVVPDEPEGIALEEASFGLARAAATLSGGVPGHVYSVSNRVTLSDGRSDERSITLRVEQR